MPSIYNLKPKFQALLRPIVRALALRKITANQVTVAACILSVLCGFLVAAVAKDEMRVFLLLPVVLFLRMALNAIDGMLAREHDMKSALGAVLNEVGDVVADVGLYFCFLVVPEVSAVLLFLALFLGVISEYVGVIGQTLGAGRRYDGPMGKSDRAFAFGLLAAILGCGVSPGSWVNLFLAIISVLLLRTILNRTNAAIKPQL